MYALLYRLSIIISLGIRELVALGDSRNVVKSLNRREPPKGFRLASILSKIEKTTQKLAKISFYQIMREHNGKTDSMANEAT